MWGAAPMTMLVTHSRIRSIEQSTHLPVCSNTKKANLTEIQTNPSVTPFFTMR